MIQIGAATTAQNVEMNDAFDVNNASRSKLIAYAAATVAVGVAIIITIVAKAT